MRNKLLFLSLAPLLFTACDKKTESQTGEQSTGNEKSAAQMSASGNAAFHSALTNVVGNLDTNGSHFSVTHIDEDLKQLAQAVDGLLDIARESSGDVPPDLRVVELLGDLGLNNVDAMGRSSRWNESAWHNRLFIQTGGSRSGVLSVMGDEGVEWQAGKIAPSDADMVVELELNLRQLRQTMKVVSASFGEEAQQGFAQAMQEKVADGAMTVGDLMGKMDLRATLMVSLDREKRWKVSEELELPTMHVAMRIDRANWIWDMFGKQIEADAEVSERDGLKIVKAPEEMDTPMGKLRPIIVLNQSEDMMWIALTEEYLEKCQSGTSTLATSEDFKKATAGFPAKGNGLFYLSGDFCNELVQQVVDAREKLPEGSEASLGFDAIIGLLNFSAEEIPHGYAWSVSNTKNGILCVGNAPFPDKGYGMMSSIAPISAMAAMATPVILKQKKKADQIMAVNNMKQMFFVMVEYDADTGEFPKQLEDLVKKEYITQQAFNDLSTVKVGGKTMKLVYISGHSTSDNARTIIMHTPAPIDGKRAFLRVDGSVQTVLEAEFGKLMKKQQAGD